MSDSATSPLNLSDIQGFILRGYHMQHVSHFICRINDVAAAKRLLAKASGPNSDFLQVTTADKWTQGKPAYCMNISIPFAGLSRLINTQGINFPGRPFCKTKSVYEEGAKAAAQRIGDTGQSAPQYWQGQLGTENAQVVFSLFSADQQAQDKYSKILTEGVVKDGAYELLHQFNGAAFADDKIHFGYRDGIAQPQIEGGPAKPLADEQVEVPSWHFVLQQTNDATYKIITEQEKQLLINGSFAAFRVLEQDVAGFEDYLNNPEVTAQIEPELLAAKMCGRWRNGDPLVLNPDNKTEVLPKDINKFEYFNADPHGIRCPVSSHIRRSNPRNQVVPGNTGGKSIPEHRIIRRGMPYGPKYNPGSGTDSVERGLLGMFICADLVEQFEFISTLWLQGSNFSTNGPAGKDPLLGTNDVNDSIFKIPQAEGEPIVLKGFPQFIKTRGSAYVFLPSMTALKYIAQAEV
jgi:Dyp-type peroxidase family